MLLSNCLAHVLGIFEIREFHDIKAIFLMQQDISSADVAVNPAHLMQDFKS